MDPKVGSILLFLAVILSLSVNARSSSTVDIIVAPTELQATNEMESSKEDLRNEQLCTLCEEYTTEALDYLNDIKIQSEIISSLHQACSQLQPFKHKCVALVDYYMPLLFEEISTIRPDLFCEKVSLCELLSVQRQNRDNACTLCERVVSEVLIKLQDPDTQLEIIQTLLKACSKIEGFEQECKKLVFEYGPIVLANAEKYLAKSDICHAIRVCKPGQETALLRELPLYSA